MKGLEKRNIAFSKDGMKVGVKEMNSEDYEDKTQRCDKYCVGISIY